MPRAMVFELPPAYRDERHTELHWTTWEGGKRYLCPFGFFIGTESEFKTSHDKNFDEGCSPLEFDARRTPGVIGPCVE